MNFHTALVNDFHLETIYAEQLKSYYVLHWRGDYLRSYLHMHNGYIEHNGVVYVPIFKDNALGTPTFAQIVRLSFRETVDPNDPNYVLIKKLGT